MTERAEGLDCSYWQGPNSQYTNTDWQAAKVQGGISFGFIRACQGTYTDPTFVHHWQKSFEAGVLRGAYCYLLPYQNMQAQAAHLYSLTQGGGDLPDVADVEQAGLTANKVKAFLDHYETLSGRKCIIYTGVYFWEDAIGNPDWSADYDLWIANPPPREEPNVPAAWKDKGWTFWQDSFTTSYPGWDDPTIDHNVFNGTVDELYKYAGQQVPLTLEQKVALLWAAHPELHP